MNTKPATDSDSCASALPPARVGEVLQSIFLLETAVTFECNLNLLCSKKQNIF